MVDGAVTTAFDASVNPGSEVALNLSRPFPRFRHPRIEIVYEDDHVLVVNKGYGLLSVGTQSHKKEENAYEILKTYVKKCGPGKSVVYVVHRLDRDTSGLMMFAKSEEAQGGAPSQLEQRHSAASLCGRARGLSSRRTEGMSKAVWPRIRSLWSIPPTILMKAGWR